MQEPTFSGFRERTFLADRRHLTTPGLPGNPTPQRTASSVQTPAVPALGRSGKCFQLCWVLRTVVNVITTQNSVAESTWNVRPGAFYHCFDVVNGRTLWITTSGREDIQESVQQLTGQVARPEDIDFSSPQTSFEASLSVHLLLATWANQGWREYVRYLEEAIENKVRLLLSKIIVKANQSEDEIGGGRYHDSDKAADRLSVGSSTRSPAMGRTGQRHERSAKIELRRGTGDS